jgi:hypothetical protein
VTCEKRRERMRKTGIVVAFVVVAAVAALVVGCSNQQKAQPEVLTIASFPIESREAVVDTSMVTFDPAVSYDGNGSLSVTTEEPITVTLYDLGDMDLENVELDYAAEVKCEDVDGQVFIEMVCVFPEKGDFFSRALGSELSGTTDWTLQETPFYLQVGENPGNVLLNLVINGSGTAWIDDIRVTGTPLVGNPQNQ